MLSKKTIAPLQSTIVSIGLGGCGSVAKPGGIRVEAEIVVFVLLVLLHEARWTKVSDPLVHGFARLIAPLATTPALWRVFAAATADVARTSALNLRAILTRRGHGHLLAAG